MTTLDHSPRPVMHSPARHAGHVEQALRLRAALAGRAAVQSVTAFFAVPLVTLWIVVVALAPLTLIAPLVIPATWLVRRYADANRGAPGRLLGARIDSPYREQERGLFARVLGILRDPASWRDLCWEIGHVAIGAFLAILSLSLLLGSVFWMIYPFLYAVTPDDVFGRPFGGLIELTSVGQAFAFVPLGVLTLAVWWFAALPLARAEASYTRAMLRARPAGA